MEPPCKYVPDARGLEGVSPHDGGGPAPRPVAGRRRGRGGAGGGARAVERRLHRRQQAVRRRPLPRRLAHACRERVSHSAKPRGKE